MASRRSFLKKSGLAVAGTWLLPAFLKNWEAQALAPGDKVLVVVQLSGGNDGLNTVVPFGHDAYYRARPTLGVEASKVLKINEEQGFNPALEKLHHLYDQGLVTVFNGVGYPNPDRSHFRAMDIWHTASAANQYLTTGWLGRYLDASCQAQCQAYRAIEVDDTLSLALKGELVKGIALQDPRKLHRNTHSSQFAQLKQAQPAEGASENVAYLYKTLAETASSADYIYEKSRVQQSRGDYPASQFARRLKTVAELITSGVNTRVYYVSLSGFDTHVRQAAQQERLLREYAEGMAAFVQDMKQNNRLRDVMVLTFSEFGRRVAQNASGGTDHGTANNLWVINGGLTKPGVFNPAPNLTDLDEGDLKFAIDFRNIYATLVRRWLEAEIPGILGGQFTELPFA
ncbi:MAG: DUF1501 domain-containing protein [Bernardetiaceae bacterium]|jgi:uncharacterized protein (DUF1501 family)|nr:DUF1501 domain-containing protein [Bernardetiaceae bacterium]